jgi:hypothetical protein
VTAGRDFARGGEVRLNDGRPNGERLLATGAVQPDNKSNYLLFETELVRSDKLYSSKREVLQSMGIQARSHATRVSTGCLARAKLHSSTREVQQSTGFQARPLGPRAPACVQRRRDAAADDVLALRLLAQRHRRLRATGLAHCHGAPVGRSDKSDCYVLCAAAAA